MKTRNLLRFSVLIIITLLLCLSSCPHPELPGDIEGIVIDAKTSEPIYQAKVKLDTPDDSTSTQINGSYILKNIDPGNYEIKASKSGYAPETENVKVISHRPVEKNFSLTEIPTLKVSTNKLDFGLDSTSLKFYISKVGSGTLAYAILTSQDWIKSSPENGELAEGTDSAVVNVNINRADLLKRKYIDTITVSQMYGTEVIQEVKIGVYLNGIWINLKYVNIVLIGTQVWMGENLNVGTRIDGSKDQADNGITEKYCYSDGEYNCDTYGGLYQWDEMMQYNPPEDSSKIIGTTQGI